MNRLRHIWVRILDHLFPRSPIEEFTSETFTDAVTPTPRLRDELWSAFQYSDKNIRDAIWELKYNGSTHAAKLLADALTPHLNEHIADTLVILGRGRIHITSIPGDSFRVRQRGVDHVKLLAEHLPNHLFAYSPLLERTKRTKQQTKQQSKRKRFANVFHSMEVIDDSLPMQTPIIVLDDVITTGATMQEAFRALEEAGYQNVIGVSIAH